MTKQDYYLPVPGNIVLRRDKEDERGEGQGGERSGEEEDTCDCGNRNKITEEKSDRADIQMKGY